MDHAATLQVYDEHDWHRLVLSRRYEIFRDRGALRTVLTVVNVGGGLARAGDQALAALCREVGEAAAEHRIVVVPGGGEFADSVRNADERFGLRRGTAHRMALLAMDQFGCLLADLIPDATLCRSVSRAREATTHGRAAVLLPADQLTAEAPLPESSAVTSDSIAVWVAGVLGGARAVLLKAADGLYADWPPEDPALARMSVAELAAHQSEGRCDGVDAYLPAALHDAGVDVWIVSGREPTRLIDLLRAGETVGTRVTRRTG